MIPLRLLVKEQSLALQLHVAGAGDWQANRRQKRPV